MPYCSISHYAMPYYSISQHAMPYYSISQYATNGEAPSVSEGALASDVESRDSPPIKLRSFEMDT